MNKTKQPARYTMRRIGWLYAVSLFLSACALESVGDVSEVEDELQLDQSFADQEMDSAIGSDEATFAPEPSLSCGFVEPPRCGPRNCVAMCVTCLYDICRATGGSCEDCKADMEICKEECNEGPT